MNSRRNRGLTSGVPEPWSGESGQNDAELRQERLPPRPPKHLRARGKKKP